MANRSKVLITGCRGQLGSELMTAMAGAHEVTGFDIDTVDITDADAVRASMSLTKPAIVLHTAAFTDVDGCESDEKTAMDVNGRGTENVAAACREVGARMIYYSTDYVFDGQKDSAYIESDAPNPGTVYGKSKLAGEEAVIETLEDHAILRIAWVYGAVGRNFVKTIIDIGRRQLAARRRGETVRELTVVDDQVGNPTWTADIARQTEVVIDRGLTGVYHATSEGECSWYDLAKAVFEILELPVELKPCSTDLYPRPAPRPARSSLENDALKRVDANAMRPWRDSLEEFFRSHEEMFRE